MSGNAVRSETFYPPINEVIKLYKGGITDVETLTERCGWQSISSLLEAAHTVNGNSSRLDWVKSLENSYATFEQGDALEKLGKKMKKGEEVDLSQLNSIAAKATAGQSHLVPASNIEPKEVPFILTGYPPIDDHLGGFPQVGVILVGAAPGTGKTSLALRMTKSFLKQYPEKKVSFFSIEMIAEELRMRGEEVAKFSKSELERWIICDDPVTPDQVINRAATIDDLGLVVIDFADLMITGESSEGRYTQMYTTLMLGAKSLRCPILLLAQFSGNYQGGIPRPNHFRWTRLAEALAWMVLTLWNPETDYFAKEQDDNEETLPVIDGCSYICAWKVRGGFRMHRDESPGAISIPFNGGRGWHPSKSKWFVMRREVPKVTRSRYKD